jgi:Holliday junction resolvase
MSQYNKTKGSQFETDVMKWLRGKGVVAERLSKAGAKDEGDIVTVIAGETYILELKNKLRRLTMQRQEVLGKSLCLTW